MKKTLFVVFSHYPSDTRIRKEANALFKNGYDVDVLCLKDNTELSFEIFENIKIFRINIKKKRGSSLNYFLLYTLFFFSAFYKITKLYLQNRYDVIHVNNMPNFIVFTSFIPKLFGSRVILDLHDPLPEILMSELSLSYNSIFFKIAVLEEKLSIWFADEIITTNIAFKELFISRGCKEEKITIVMNSPQTNIFNNIMIPKSEANDLSQQKFKLMYNGTIIKRHGLDILIDAVNLLIGKIPNIELNIFGDGEFLPEVLEKIELLKLNNYVKYRGSFLVDRIAEEIPHIDIGIIPNRFNVFTNLNFPIRIFEFIHFKKAVVVPRTKGISDYFNDDSIFYFQAENVKDLANVILNIYNNSIDCQLIIERAYKVYLNNTWEIQSKNLLAVYNKLISNNNHST